MALRLAFIFTILTIAGCGMRYYNSEFYKKNHRMTTSLETEVFLKSIVDSKIDTFLICYYDYLLKSNRMMSFVYYQHNGEYYLKHFTLVRGHESLRHVKAKVKESDVIKLDHDKIFSYYLKNYTHLVADSNNWKYFSSSPSSFVHRFILNKDTLSFAYSQSEYNSLQTNSARKQAIDSVLHFLYTDKKTRSKYW